MANKNFGIKQLNLVGESGTPTIESPDNLNLTANIVAISTDMTIGGQIQSNLRIGSSYSVGIGTTNPTSKLTVTGNVKVVGVVTATSFFGDGSTLTGIVGSGSGVAIKDSGSTVGTAGTIDFGDNLTVSAISAGIVTVTGSAGGGSSQFVTTAAGIHTLSNVGIGLTNPTSVLTVSGDALINGLIVGRGGGNASDNTALGVSCLGLSTIGNYNTGIGYWSLFSNTTGTFNSASGQTSLYSNISGTNNSANGFASLGSNIAGNFNTANGVASLFNNTIGNNNTGIGASSGFAITTGSKNTLLGSYTGNQNGLDIRTSSNNVVLSDGDGNIRFYANSSGNVGLGTTNPTEKLTVVGVTSSTSFYGDASYTASGRWTLGANGFSDYTFTGIGFTQTTNDPVLYLARGRVYEFVNNSGGSHPFQIRVSDGGSAYSNGVTNNGGASGVIRFEIPFNAPNTLYYQCTSHSGMGNTISVYPNTI